MAASVLRYLPPAVQVFVERHPTASTAVLGAVLMIVIAVIYQRFDSSSAESQGDAPHLPGVFNAIKGTGQKAEEYTDLHYGKDVAERKAHAQTMTNHYYDLVTSFYEYGWGDSFHFAPRCKGETFRESISRHEFALASRLELKPGMRVLDVGCGVGGPARNIARFSGATVTGLNNNEFQVGRATLKAHKEGLSSLCNFIKGDFMNIPVPDSTYDAAFAIEATCHAPDRVGVFSEVFRVLKPGAVFGSYEWVMTSKYDPSNKLHNEIKKGIEVGDSLPDLITGDECVAAMREAGFEVLEVNDLSDDPVVNPVPWYEPFLANWNVENFKSRPLGLIFSHTMVEILEFLRIAPKGSAKIHTHLWTATKTLKAGGELGIFTPMMFIKARKPLSAKGVAAPTVSRGRATSPAGRR